MPKKGWHYILSMVGYAGLVLLTIIDPQKKPGLDECENSKKPL
jgi:hypothetical protein